MFKLLCHTDFPKAAIKSRKAEERKKAKEQLKAIRKGKEKKTERGIGHRKRKKSVKSNSKSPI